MSASRPTLLRSTAVMAVGTVLSRVTGVGRAIALAYAFGLSEFAGSYQLANQTPTAIYELVVGGILSATLVPVFVRLFTKSKDDTPSEDEDPWRAVSAVMTMVGATVIFLAIVLFIAAPWLVSLSAINNEQASIEDQKQVATFLLRLFVPQVALYGFISVATALLHAHRRFGPPMFAPIFNNLVLIFLFLAAPRLINDTSIQAIAQDQVAMLYMGLGTTAGVAAMALLLAPLVRSESHGRIKFFWAPRHPTVVRLIKLSGWTLGFVIANQAAYWLSVILAYGEASGLAAYQNAYIFFILPHGIYAVSVMSALQPELAEHWANGALEKFRERVITGIRLILFLIVPGAVGYALLTESVVSVALERGAFDSNDVDITSSLLFWMVVGLPGFSAFLFFTRAFQAMEAARTVFFLYLFENGVNIIAALLLYPVMGVDGVGLGQTLGYTFGAVAAAVTLRRHLQRLNGRRLIDGACRMLIASVAMGLIVWQADHLVAGPPIWGLLCALAAGAFTYFAGAWLLRIDEVGMVLRRRKAA